MIKLKQIALWNAIVRNGGEESACGWCKDKMQMRKIDISAIEAARHG